MDGKAARLEQDLRSDLWKSTVLRPFLELAAPPAARWRRVAITIPSVQKVIDTAKIDVGEPAFLSPCIGRRDSMTNSPVQRTRVQKTRA